MIPLDYFGQVSPFLLFYVFVTSVHSLVFKSCLGLYSSKPIGAHKRHLSFRSVYYVRMVHIKSLQMCQS